MASRPKGFGMTAELQNKEDAKYDVELARDAVEWISAVIGETLDGQSFGQEDVGELLKDGVTLCNLINVLQPETVKKINSSKMAFKMMENIGNFLAGAEQYGVNKTDLFQTVDLYEKQNMAAVIAGICALGRKASSKGFDGPSLGAKEAQENKREFSDEQLREGRNVIGLQMGSNKGASQAGQNFGKTRAIID